MRQGWELTKKSWSVVRRHPKLLRLTITGGIMAFLVALVVGGPGLWLSASDMDSTRYVGWGLLAIASYGASFFVIYYNVALAAAADDSLAGRDPDLAAAKARARNLLPAIAGWALVSMIVAVLFSVLRDKGGSAGRILGSLGAAAWGFVTFFVVPVLALEGIGPINAVKRSSQLVRQKWGQQVTGNVAIGGLATLVSMLGAIIAVVGVVLLVTGATANVVIGVILVVAGAVLLIASSVVAGAMRGVFGVALYHFGVDDEARGPFERSELTAAAS